MTQSIQNYDNRNRYNVPPNANQQGRVQPQAVRLPEFYVQNKRTSFKEALEDNPMYSTIVKGFFGPLIEHPFASVLTWFGCGFLLDMYTKACGGEYEKSLLKKVTNFGDNIENSKFVQSKPVQKLLNVFKKGGGKISNFLGKSSVIRAIKNTPSMPELEIVKSEMIPQRQRVIHDFNLIVQELKLRDDKGFAPLHKLDVSKEEKNTLKTIFKVQNISEIPEERASSFIQLKRLGKTNTEILNAIAQPDGGISAAKKAVLEAMGNKDAAWLKAVQEDTIGKYIGEVQEATLKVGSKVRICMGNYRPFGLDLGVLTIPSKRVVGCDNVCNRLISLDPTSKIGAKTATGRFMSKFMQMVHRGLTFGGGKWGVLLFIAPAFVETAINVHKAEPDQKIGTGVNNLVNHISWVFTFPFALQIMHHICGAQYAGMKKEDVQALRKLQSDFNKKNKYKGTDEESKGFKNYEEYNKERKIVNEKMKNLKKVKGQKWYTKCIRKLADIITPDLGKLDAYNTGNMITRKFSQLRNLPRNLWGVPLRLLIFGGLTMGVLDAILNKSIKLIFGDSYDSMKEEEIKDAKKEQKKFLKEDLNDRLYETQRKKLAAIAKARQKNKNQQQDKQYGTKQNLTHKGTMGADVHAIFNTEQMGNNTDNYSYMPSQKDVVETQSSDVKQDNYSYIPSQENTIQAPLGKAEQDTYSYIPSQNSTIESSDKYNTNSTVRTYIPSQTAANITKNWDNSGLQSALDRAQRAEERALKVLAGNFEGM